MNEQINRILLQWESTALNDHEESTKLAHNLGRGIWHELWNRQSGAA